MADELPNYQGHAGGQSSAGHHEDLLAQLIARHLPPEPTLGQMLATHQHVFSVFWFQLAVLMGHGGAQIVFARAIHLAVRQAPLAAHVRPAATALDFTALESLAPASGEVAQLGAALAAAVEQLIGSLLGPGLSRALMRDVELTLARQPQTDQNESPSSGSHGEEGSQQ